MVPVPMVENFGFAPPMGSIKVVLKLTWMREVGNPVLGNSKLLQTQNCISIVNQFQWLKTLVLLLQWVLKVTIEFYFALTNLNAGKGYACAGHVSVTDTPECLSRWILLISIENFGFAPPIGSKNIPMISSILYYLNAGTGYAWAGQDKLIVSASSFNIIDPLDSWANFGLAPPIGSMKNLWLTWMQGQERPVLDKIN